MPDDDFAALVRDWQRPIYNLAYRWLGNQADASDAAQEAFVRILEKWPLYDRSRELKPWIYQVAARSIRNGIRSRRRAIDRDRRVASTASESSPQEEDRVERAEREALIDREIARLPSEQRELIALHYFCDLTHRELAEVLECPKSTVQSRIRKALDQLGARLRQSGHAALLPALESTLRRRTDLPVPDSLARTLESLVSSTSTVGAGTGTTVATTSITATTIGGLIVSKSITALVLVSIALGIGYFVGRTGSSSASEGAAASRSGSTELQVATRALDEWKSRALTLEERVDELDRANQRLTAELAAKSVAASAESTASDVAPEAELHPGAVDFETLSRLLGENLELLARTAIDEDRTLTAEERARVMATHSAAAKLVGDLTELSDHALFDLELGPRIFDTLYGGALQLDDATRRELVAAASRVHEQIVGGLDLERTSVVERYDHRMALLDAMSTEIRDLVGQRSANPSEALARFERADGIARGIAEGGRAEYRLGLANERNREKFHEETTRAWSDIYSLQPTQLEPVRRISKQMLESFEDYQREQLAWNPDFDAGSPEAQREFRAMQARAEQSILDLLTPEQLARSQDRLPALFSIDGSSHTRIAESSGLGL